MMGYETFKEKMEHLNGRIYQLDLSVEEERQYYLESVGGEEQLKAFPLLYQSFQKACRKPSRAVRDEISGLSGSEQQKGIKFKFYDLMYEKDNRNVAKMAGGDSGTDDQYVLKVNYTGDFLDTDKSLQEPTPADPKNVYVYGKVYDPNSSRFPYMDIYDSHMQVNHVDIERSSDESYRKEEFDGRVLRQKVVLTVLNDKNGNGYDSYVCSQDNQVGSVESSPFSNIEFEAPVSIKNKDEIRILYGRTSANLENPDYEYDSNVVTDNKLHTIVPIKGKVTLKTIRSSDNYYKFDGLQKPEEGEQWTRSTLQVDGKDWKTYQGDKKDKDLYNILNDGKHFKVVQGDDGHDKTLEFDLFNPKFTEGDDRRYDWENDMTGTELDGRERYSYLVGGFYYTVSEYDKDGKRVGIPFDYAICCRSKKQEDLNGRKYYEFKEGSNTIYIPVLRLWWGCYAGNSKIRMADGSLKDACRLRKGDEVYGYGGETLILEYLYSGQEAQMVCICTDAGHRLMVTKDHPLLREGGEPVSAARLLEGERILTEDGVAAVTSAEIVPYHDRVYNFTFCGHEQGVFLLADGLYAGDFYAQNSAFQKRPEPTEEQKQLMLELQQLAEVMGHSSKIHRSKLQGMA